MKLIPEAVQKAMLNKALDYLDKDPEENIPKVLEIVEKLNFTGQFDRPLAAVRKYISDPENIWYKMIKSFWTDVDDGIRKTAFRNFLINGAFLGVPKQNALGEKEGVQIPWNMQIDITSACNLRCKGCWAADYGHTLNLTYEELDDIISQGEAMHTHYYIFSGGEPTMRKKDVIRICENHPESEFMMFTNATLIDEAFCDEILRVKNLIPVPSIEGIGESTDFRRGDGVYDKCVKAMELMKKKKLLFGISCCYTQQTYKFIGSTEWYDQMMAWGCKFAWFFLYMPVGNSAQPEMMVSTEARQWMYDSVHAHRKTHGIFVLDFWNDGEYVDGCIAAGKEYLHINAAGDIEPCAFIHYADHNIRTGTIMDALKGPLFQAYKAGQPFNKNPLRPCPLLDNPDCLQKMVQESGAHSTDLESPEDVVDLTNKTRPNAASWAAVADDIVTSHYGTVCGNKGCDHCSQAYRCPDVGTVVKPEKVNV